LARLGIPDVERCLRLDQRDGTLKRLLGDKVIRVAHKSALALLAAIVIIFLTRGYWLPSIARGLICRERLAPSDAILVENFDPSYLVFERAESLQRARLSTRVLVPVPTTGRNSAVPSPVSQGIAELMARIARLDNIQIIPVREMEPYELSVAYQIRDFLIREHLRSLLVVAPAFRSRRSYLVYNAVLGPAGIESYCAPVFETHTPENWAATPHGIQEVTEQFIKLQYYRLYVLPLGQ
jgi:hypothetical protein